jgi:two-component system, chemotaxis family, chemotaxis protein CheY
MFDPKVKILVVDDMAMMRKAVTKFCKDMGFSDFTEAADGVEAWEKIAAANPPFDLIISDWNMPNCSGLDLLKRIRADGRVSKTPVIMVTAEKEKDQIIEAIKAGVSDYVVKPFTPQTLQEKLQAVSKKVAA